MIKPLRSFYGRLSLLFLLLVILLAASTLFIAFQAAGHLFDEVEQELNRKYASSLAVELQPFVTDEIQTDMIMDRIQYMMVLNPMVEIYLISGTGEVLAYFTGPGDMVKRHQIDMVPVKTFVFGQNSELIRGDDPRTTDQVKPFSAAPLKIAGKQGFVYVILRGRNFDRSLGMIRSSYYIRSGLISFLLALAVTLIAGFSLFSLLTSRLRKLGKSVKGFEEGDYGNRVEVKGADEIAGLGRAFNDMARSVEESIEQRNDLITNISHDLRSPLTSIRGNIETVLLKDALSAEEQKTYLESALKSVSAFQKLVEQLFELSKLESRDIKINREIFIPAELAQDIILKYKLQAEKKDIELKLNHSERNSPFSGDIALLERALSNLLENAINYTGEGGIVCLTLEEKTGKLFISVSDTGQGIPPEEAERVFERFYRGDKSRDRRISGTGLGLSITREIVELHRGTINLETSGNRGTTFIIELPL
ncbi:sensor histidine kinase [Spirochaeta isovalerica]|uniref:histidine kinase n=1 Tax=Spirochaeta isovalerica TaxID=150 RepID=A0A841RCN9_9SPIO|nr:HAMP domain-containing sensor histidine kinase [Spirochaeta isovalerica]MBB6480428.1 signal transduction histidine kinase [Spirochaeta isovalerica]